MATRIGLLGLVTWASQAGCKPGEAGTDEDDPTALTTETDAETDPVTEPDPDTDTVGPTDEYPSDTATPPIDTGAPPTEPTSAAVGVSCAITANSLRFECTVTVDPPQPVELSFVRADGLSATRTVSGDAVAAEHLLNLYFMAPAQDYTVTAYATAFPADVATTTVTTGVVPAGVAAHLNMTGASTIGMMGVNSPCSDIAAGVVFDTVTGDLLWYQMMDAGGTFGADDMLTFTEDHTLVGESVGDVIEIDLMGNDLVRLPDLADDFGITADGLFGNFHHDIMKRNGLYYVVYQEVYGGGGFNKDVLDNLIVFDASGTELMRWVAANHLDIPADWSGDFMHTNTIFVDHDGDILLSFLNQGTVVRLDGDLLSPTFGDTEWLMQGNGDGEIGNTITIDWSGVGAPSSFSDQHHLNLRPDGKLELLDNGHGRALVFEMDEVAGTAAAVGEYDTHDGDCGPQGTATSTLAGNTIVGCAGAWIREFDQATATLAWEAEVKCEGGGGGNAYAVRWYPLEGW